MKWLPRLPECFSSRVCAADSASAKALLSAKVPGRVVLPLAAAALLLLAGQVDLSASVLGENPKITVNNPLPVGVTADGLVSQFAATEEKIGAVLTRELKQMGNLDENFYVGVFTARETAAGSGDYAIELLRMTPVVPGKNHLRQVDEAGVFSVDANLYPDGNHWLFEGKIAYDLNAKPSGTRSISITSVLPKGLFIMNSLSRRDTSRVVRKSIDEQKPKEVTGFFSLRPEQEAR